MEMERQIVVNILLAAVPHIRLYDTYLASGWYRGESCSLPDEDADVNFVGTLADAAQAASEFERERRNHIGTDLPDDLGTYLAERTGLAVRARSRTAMIAFMADKS